MGFDHTIDANFRPVADVWTNGDRAATFANFTFIGFRPTLFYTIAL